MAERTPLHEATAAAGAAFREECGWLLPAHFGDASREYHLAHQECVLIDQSPRGKIEVHGADAARFLHNLSTNDIVQLSLVGGCEAFLTTAKAKVIAYLLVFHAEEQAFWLDLAPGAEQRVMQHLDRYLISEQVEFFDRTRELAQMHLAGPQAPDVLHRVFAVAADPSSAGKLQIVTADGSIQLRRNDSLGLPGYDILCPAAQAVSVWQRLLQAGARPMGWEGQEVLRIEAGMPREGADIDENTFAPEVGRIAETISYSKGCYLGQESIVMARDRGQVNRTLMGVKMPSGPAPQGSLLYALDKEVGRVTSSIHSPRLGTAIGLAYLRRGHQTPGTMLEVDAAGKRAPAEVAPLPFR